MLLWTPMFLSSLRLTISNPGFMLGYGPDAKLSGLKTAGLVFVDLAMFLLHPIILWFRISYLNIQQAAMMESRDLDQCPKYNRNVRKLAIMKNHFYSYKRLELN